MRVSLSSGPADGVGGRNLSNDLCAQRSLQPEPTEPYISLKGIMILDKIWHHVKQKQQKFWIWKALDRDPQQLLTLERRHRDQAASNQMVQRPPY